MENIRTAGKWEHFIQPGEKGYCDTINVGSYRIATMEDKENSVLDAMFICTAVNNYNILLEALKRIEHLYDWKKDFAGRTAHEAIQKTLTNKSEYNGKLPHYKRSTI